MENLGMFNTGAEMDIPMGEPKGLYGPVWLNGIEVTGWHMRAGLRPQEPLEYWPELAGELPWASPDTPTLTGPVWVRAHFTMPPSFDGAVRICLEHAGKGQVWLNGRNIGRYWHLGPQRDLWLPQSWLQPDNTLVIFEELDLTPANITVHCHPFGQRSTLTL
jgi:beta-galactosidase